MDKEILTKLREKYGEVKVIQTKSGSEFVFRKPEWAHVKRFFDKAAESSFDATLGLVIDTVVYPENAQEILREKPGLVMSFGGHLLQWIGVEEVVEVKN